MCICTGRIISYLFVAVIPQTLHWTAGPTTLSINESIVAFKSFAVVSKDTFILPPSVGKIFFCLQLVSAEVKEKRLGNSRIVVLITRSCFEGSLFVDI